MVIEQTTEGPVMYDVGLELTCILNWTWFGIRD